MGSGRVSTIQSDKLYLYAIINAAESTGFSIKRVACDSAKKRRMTIIMFLLFAQTSMWCSLPFRAVAGHAEVLIFEGSVRAVGGRSN
jgi:hypothetical protein